MLSETDLILNEDGSVYHLGLVPGQIAETVLLVGDPERVPSISKHFDAIDFQVNNREFVCHTGRVGSKPVSVLSSGMGTDNVEILMVELDAVFNLKLDHRTPKDNLTSLTLIRIGTSGSLRPEIPVGSMLCSQVATGLDALGPYYTESLDNALNAYLMDELGFNPNAYQVEGNAGLVSHFGKLMQLGHTLTLPGFYAPQGRKTRVASRFPTILDRLVSYTGNPQPFTNMEMETAGYYLKAKHLGHRMVSLNALLANRALHQFDSNPSKTVDKLVSLVLAEIAYL